MTDRKDAVRPDPELEPWLEDARDVEARAPEVDYAAMFSSLETEIARAEKRPSFWLRTRSTPARVAVAVAAGIAIAIAAVLAVGLRGDMDHYPPLRMGIALGGLGLLLALSAHQALRPLHRPALPAWVSAGLVVVTLGATFVVSVLPPDLHAGHFPPAIIPCFLYGLLAGLPVYAVLRLLDRGQRGLAAPILAACAAGLLGNLVLTLFCPSGDAQHLMFGHFGVALSLVAGIGIVHALVRRR